MNDLVFNHREEQIYAAELFHTQRAAFSDAASTFRDSRSIFDAKIDETIAGKNKVMKAASEDVRQKSR